MYFDPGGTIEVGYLVHPNVSSSNLYMNTAVNSLWRKVLELVIVYKPIDDDKIVLVE